MGSHGRKQYTADFKRDAVGLITQQGYSVAEAAQNLGVHASLLRRWKTEVERTGPVAFPGKGHQTPDQAELHRLREENRRLRMERDILKKATAFFASEPR
jgi:transposase